jgi:muconolactone delta-isomerase
MEMAGAMIEGMKAWSRKYTASKKMEQIWTFAGIGGGGIVNVASAEELDAIMGEYPFAQFSAIEIYPLADLEKGLDNFSNALKRMAPPK